MCLLRVNQDTIDSLNYLTSVGDNKRKGYEKRLIKFADDANLKNPAKFDDPAGALKYMPEDLRHIRHYEFGRHRVYVSGSHKNCHYASWWIKEFKRDGKLVEGGPEFQQILRDALADPRAYLMSLDADTATVKLTDWVEPNPAEIPETQE